MADEPPKKASERFAGWKKAAQGKVAQTGGSQDVVRKAMEVNPALKGDKSTQDLFDEVAKARRQGADPKASPDVAKPKVVLVSDPTAMPKTDPNDLLAVFAATKAWLQKEDQRVAAAEAQAKADAEALRVALAGCHEQTRAQVGALIARVDPDVSSPITQALLEGEASFLKRIGFSK